MIAFITPICYFNCMHNQAVTGIVCVDSSGGFEKSDLRLFVFTSPFVTGAIPVAYGICRNESIIQLTKLFSMIKVNIFLKF